MKLILIVRTQRDINGRIVMLFHIFEPLNQSGLNAIFYANDITVATIADAKKTNFSGTAFHQRRKKKNDIIAANLLYGVTQHGTNIGTN